MNIKRAKQEIKDTIEAYLLKDEYGEYVIPQIRQRPVLLLGAPGIGKTQIMEQIAKACGIGLVAYTITHHTRQSAIGLPFIAKQKFGGREYSVTEYTMSEIVASVYEKMEKTGLSEGILFIDEINCVSETLAPAMLQFLQCKTFGSHEIPQGWIIVAAGNPPEYNKSVREFDVVTMDRVKKIEVEPDFAVWKEYALQQQLHPAVIAYLNTRTSSFYKMETTVDGRKFATPRGWEDLSQMLIVYEMLGKEMDRDVVVQYVQHEAIAKDFANYLELYRKYQMDYQLDAVLGGTIDPILLKKASHASFDERLSVVSLLLARCRKCFADLIREEECLELLFEQLKLLKEGLLEVQENTAFPGQDHPEETDHDRCCRNLSSRIESFRKETQRRKEAELLTRGEAQRRRSVEETLEDYLRKLQQIKMPDEDGASQQQTEMSQEDGASQQQNEMPQEDGADRQQTKMPAEDGASQQQTEMADAFAQVKVWFEEAQDALDRKVEEAGAMLEHAFDFMEEAYGRGQELVIFITELNNDRYSVQFLQEYDCERYYRYNRELLFDESGRAIEERLRTLGK